MQLKYQSWGRYPKALQSVKSIYWIQDTTLDFNEIEGTVLPYGLGRSYGDVCLNDKGTILDMSRLRRFISFDRERGVLRCEAGVTLEDILEITVPEGWFLPVTPGTRFVTVGGAIANDIHGKNHHHAGTFGCHVKEFELLRSNGERIVCSREVNPELFGATIGGLGLTGVILWAEILLKKIHSPCIYLETIKYDNLEQFFQLSDESDPFFDYTVAWIDCLSKGDKLGRGLFMRGNHTETGVSVTSPLFNSSGLHVPIEVPSFFLNNFTIKCFNFLYYHKQQGRISHGNVDFVRFFYPLDAIGNWNLLYGKNGFFQYQCVIPEDNSQEVVKSLLMRIEKSGVGVSLAVIKKFGDKKSPGILSFPKKGVTIALDFSYRGRQTLDLFEDMDRVVLDARGAVYPAKDARMSPSNFQAFFPEWRHFLKFVDPKFSSSFWRRVTRQ